MHELGQVTVAYTDNINISLFIYFSQVVTQFSTL